MIKQSSKAFLDIILLRGSVQNIPYSPVLLTVLILAGVGVLSLITRAHLLLLISNIAFSMMMIWLLLYFTKKTERYIQTMTALIACEWMVAAIFLVFWYLVLLFTAMSGHLKGVSPNHLSGIFSINFQKDTFPHGVGIAVELVFLALGVWKLLINIAIIRQATEWRTFKAVLFILALNILPNLAQQGIMRSGLIKKTTTTAAVTAPAAKAVTAPVAKTGSEPAQPVSVPVIPLK